MWLVGFAALAWFQSSFFPMGLSFGQTCADYVSIALIGLGIVLMGLAIFEITRHKTTFIPRKNSTTLVQSGIYKFSRNPDYLGDILVLAGLIVWWDAVLSLPLVALFGWVLNKRFIINEEAHLQKAYGSQFETYTSKVRRWF